MEAELTRKIIGAAIEVHRALGGRVYELSLLELRCQRQLAIPVKYKTIRDLLFLDILVENKIIIEVKATELDHSVYQSQLLTYLRLSGMKLGLLLNFGKKQLKDGVCRVVNGL